MVAVVSPGALRYPRRVAEIHPWLGAAVIAVCAVAAFTGGYLYWRGRGAGHVATHLLSLGQTLLVAQVGVGLLLLADDRRAGERLHYAYGADGAGSGARPVVLRARGGAAAPAVVRGHDRRRGRPCDSCVHDGVGMRRIWESRFVRGLALIAIVSAVIVALSLESVLITAGALMRIAFFLAIAFFLFLLWRERRGDIEAWSDLSRRTFYGAIVLAVVAIGALLGLGPTGADAIAFFAVIACCAWAIWRVWRREHTYG